MKVLIIEDESPAAKRLSALISELRPDALVVACLDSVEDAVEYFERGENPDLIFMDIQLADGISFDIFSKTEIKAPVIFTTAYDHYAIKAFKVNSIDYLLKPIEAHELKSALEEYELLHEKKLHLSQQYKEIIQAMRSHTEQYKKRFLVKTAGRLAFVNVEDVAFFFSDDGNSFLVTHSNDRFLLESILEEIETQLNPASFFRINRKMLVSLNAIKKIEPHFNNRFVLMLSPEFEEEVVVSRQRASAFRNWLDS